MTLETFLLFLAVFLFSCLNLYFNMNSSTTDLKRITLYLLLICMLFQVVMLIFFGMDTFKI